MPDRGRKTSDIVALHQVLNDVDQNFFLETQLLGNP